jgi:hypothetical protein
MERNLEPIWGKMNLRFLLIIWINYDCGKCRVRTPARRVGSLKVEGDFEIVDKEINMILEEGKLFPFAAADYLKTNPFAMLLIKHILNMKLLHLHFHLKSPLFNY